MVLLAGRENFKRIAVDLVIAVDQIKRSTEGSAEGSTMLLSLPTATITWENSS
jgi:hypothetical protein